MKKLKSVLLCLIASGLLMFPHLTLAGDCKELSHEAMMQKVKAELASWKPAVQIKEILPVKTKNGWAITVTLLPDWTGNYVVLDYSSCGDLLKIERGK